MNGVAARPDSASLADAAARWVSAYVHIPFCARVCPYCDFAVVAGRDDLTDRYVTALVAEIGMEPPGAGPLDALYVGGGTPSRLPTALLGEVIDEVRDRFGLAPGAEVSLEANPEDWGPEVAAGLAGAGFNRVSFGAQSFDPDVLSYLGRVHRPADTARAVREARRAGFGSVNLDLIFGAPVETAVSWAASLEAALESEPDHISTYALTVERGTALARLVSAGAPAPDPDDQADRYEVAAAVLEQAGLVRYEVSNYARPGHPCRYNLGVWAQGEYLAFGSGAHGHRAGVRRRNHRRVDAYLAAIDRGERPEAGRDTPGEWAAELERLFLSLRRTAGAVTGRGGEALLASAGGRLLVKAGVLARRADRVVVARPLLTDEVNRTVLALPEPDC